MERPNPISKMKFLWSRLANKDYRDAYVEESINNGLASQIYAIRNQRGLTQEKLADQCGMAQSRLSLLEGNYDSYSLSTLKRLASAFDVALVVKFIPFREFVKGESRAVIDSACVQFEKDTLPVDVANFELITQPRSGQSATMKVGASQLPKISMGSNNDHLRMDFADVR